MAPRSFLDLSGQRFSRLTVLRLREDLPWSKRWECACDCGATVLTNSTFLRRGNTKSCGCLQRDTVAARRRSHGDGGAGGGRKRLYRIWAGMVARCNNQGASGYANYGGRGIAVCPAWRDYVTFRDWALAHGYSDALTLDREDNNGNYEPGNCRWTTLLQQAANRRRRSPNKRPYVRRKTTPAT